MLRAVVLLNALVLNLVRFDELDRPVAGAATLVAMAGWSLAATWLYGDAARRTPWLLGADLAVAVAVLAVTPWLKGVAFGATVPGFWVMAAVLAWSAHWRWVGGLVAGAAVAATDLLIRPEINQQHYGNVFLLLIGGPMIGYLSATLQDLAVQRDRAERAAAAAAERARLARAVHDGVLQVLALVQRRGGESADADVVELGRLAGEQEAALRTLIREQDALPDEVGAGSLDLAAELARLETRPGVAVALPGTPVELPAAVVAELVAAVGACLDNVAAHVGAGAPAWVLLEADPAAVEVTVRDAGPGIAEGRLEQAAGEGRLGVSGSIRGRLADLGGTAEVRTGPGGTAWSLRVPSGNAGRP